MPDDIVRLVVLQRLRQELIAQRYQVQQIAEFDDQPGRKFELGDLVLLQLTNYQMQWYARQVRASPKLLSVWSLPIRVI